MDGKIANGMGGETPLGMAGLTLTVCLYSYLIPKLI